MIRYIALMFSACMASACAHAPQGLDRAIAASVRVTVSCDGHVLGWGSGVAVSSHQVLTARHVVSTTCDGERRYDVLSRGGAVARMVVETEDADRDVARLGFAGGGVHFDTWAQRATGEVHAGQTVYQCAGTSVDDEDMIKNFVLKQGLVSGLGLWRGHNVLVVATHVVPGNSGGALFDAHGRVLGLVLAGSMSPVEENAALVTEDLSGVWP